MSDTDFQIRSITIARPYGYSANDKGMFTTKVTLGNSHDTRMEINVDEERTLALIEQVQDLILDALNNQFANMRDDAVARIEANRPVLLEAEANGDNSADS